MSLRILTAAALRSSLGKGNSLPEVWVTSSKKACSALKNNSLSSGRCSQTCSIGNRLHRVPLRCWSATGRRLLALWWLTCMKLSTCTHACLIRIWTAACQQLSANCELHAVGKHNVQQSALPMPWKSTHVMNMHTTCLHAVGLMHKRSIATRGAAEGKLTSHAKPMSTSTATLSAMAQRPVSSGGCQPERFTVGLISSSPGVASDCNQKMYQCAMQARHLLIWKCE